MNSTPQPGLKQVAGHALAGGVQNLAGAARDLAISSVTQKMSTITDRLTEYAENGGPGLIAAVRGPRDQNAKHSLVKSLISAGPRKVKDALGGTGKAQQLKVTNIIEEIDVGAPVRVCYDQWTRFTEFPTFMKKVENVEQESDETLNWKANILWSHRAWRSTIIEQVPDRRIVWRSEGDKGSADGAVTFHEVGPDLTRIVLVLEYHPKGFVERTANVWRAQGRRARLELKHFARHVMTEAVLHPDQVQGWRGEIRDGQVVATGETADEEGDQEQQEGSQEQKADSDQERQESDQEPKADKRQPSEAEST